MDLSTIHPAIAILAASLITLGVLGVLSRMFGADSRDLGIRDGRPTRWM